MYKTNKYFLVTSSLVSVVISLLVSTLTTNATFADDNTSKTDQVNITVPVSCTLDGTGMDSHTANIQNRNYETEIGSTTLTAYCNDVDGFSIYAIGYSNEEYGNTNMIGVNTEELIPTGTTLDGSVSNWAMKLETNNEATYPIALQNGYNAYKAVPSTYTLVAKRESSTDTGTSAIGSVLTSTYAISVSPSQVADTYVGKVRYTLVHPYDAAAPEISVSIADAEYLQEVNSCPADLPEEQVYTLKDKRDEQEYKVAKLKDGKCWMVENLNIAGSTALSSEDTDFESNYTLPTTNGWTVTDGKLVLPASATKNPDNNDLTDSSQFSTDDYAYVFNSGNKENCGAWVQDTPCYSYYSWDTATLGSGRNIGVHNADAPYSICPKNWRLPTSRDTDTFDTATAEESDFYKLATNYGMSMGEWSQTTDKFYNQAGPSTIPDFLLAGSYVWGAFYNADNGGVGHYWSATTYYSGFAYANTFSFDFVSVSSSGWSSRFSGSSVRCLLKD